MRHPPIHNEEEQGLYDEYLAEVRRHPLAVIFGFCLASFVSLSLTLHDTHTFSFDLLISRSIAMQFNSIPMHLHRIKDGREKRSFTLISRTSSAA